MDKWSWKMDWCKRNGVSPASYGIWELAEKAWDSFKRSTSDERSEHYSWYQLT